MNTKSFLASTFSSYSQLGQWHRSGEVMSELRRRALQASQQAAERAIKDADPHRLLAEADRAGQRTFGIKADWAVRDGVACARIEGIWVIYRDGVMSHSLKTLGDAIQKGVPCATCEEFVQVPDNGIFTHGHPIPLSIKLRRWNRMFWNGSLF